MYLKSSLCAHTRVCIFHYKVFLSGLYIAAVRLMFWARAKPVLILRVK